jgi:hypothetical protein
MANRKVEQHSVAVDALRIILLRIAEKVAFGQVDWFGSKTIAQSHQT